MIDVEYDDKVALVRLNRGVINAFNAELVNQLSGILQKVKEDPDIHGLVLTSANEKFFSIGFDIPQLYDLDKEDFASFYRAFNRMYLALYTLPRPTAAAITGHATAGGCILALCCDYRFIAEGKKLLGLNEIKLGVPVPYLADCILRALVGDRCAREIMAAGDFYRPEQSLEMGLVDQVVPLEEVLARSVEKVKTLAALPQEAFALIKQNRTEAIEALFLGRKKEKERLFIDCWYSDQARRRLKAAIEKF